MKVISNEDYKDFLKLKSEKSEVEEYKERIRSLKRDAEDTSRFIDNLNKEHKIEVERKDLELNVKVLKATEDARKTIEKLTIENASVKKENEVLTKAFENLGFDVKDTKKIIEDLVKALGTKNTVQVIKS